MTIFLIRADIAKSFIAGHARKLPSGKVIQVAAHSDKRSRKMDVVRDDRTADLFARPAPVKPVTPIPVEAARHPERFTPDIFTGETPDAYDAALANKGKRTHSVKPKEEAETKYKQAEPEKSLSPMDAMYGEEKAYLAKPPAPEKRSVKPKYTNGADILHGSTVEFLVDGKRKTGTLANAVYAKDNDKPVAVQVKGFDPKSPGGNKIMVRPSAMRVVKPSVWESDYLSPPVSDAAQPAAFEKPHQPSVAQVLTHALKTGDLAAAIKALEPLSYQEVQEVVLRAGFSLGHLKSKTTKHVIASIQDQLVRAAKNKTDGFGVRDMTKAQPRILLLKSHVKQYTRKDGTIVKDHDDKRLKKMQPMAAGRPAAQAQDGTAKPPQAQQDAPTAPKDAEDVRGSAHGYGTHNIEVGDTLKFKAGEFEGAGKVKSAGADGAVVTDESGRDHNVHWHEVAGFNRGSTGGGGGKPPVDAGRPVGDAPEPPEKGKPVAASTVLGKQEPIPAESFNAADYAKSHDQADVSPESILTGFPPDTKEKIKAVVERLAGIEQTIYKMKNDPAYRAARTILHAKIKSEVLSPRRVKAATPEAGQKPTFVILGGRGGSGKSALTEPKSEGGLGLVDKDKFIVLDADEIKGMLPEYEGWNAAQVHEESGELFDEITRLATDFGLNICHDATMKTPKKALDLVGQFNAAGYQTEAHYMHLPRQEAAKRAVGRFLGKTGRYVPAEVILSNTQNESAFDAVKAKVGKWSFHDNNVGKGEPPILISKSGDEKPMTKAVASPIISLWRTK